MAGAPTVQASAPAQQPPVDKLGWQAAPSAQQNGPNSASGTFNANTIMGIGRGFTSPVPFQPMGNLYTGTVLGSGGG